MEINIYDLTRSELQFICKRNHISAKGTNVALQNALASLQTVEGLDEFLILPEETTKPKKRPTPVVTRSLAKKREVLNFTEASETKNRTESASVQLNEVDGEKNDETCPSHTEEVRILQNQLNSANAKLKIADMSAADIMIQQEEQNKIIQELKDRLASVESRLIEEGALRVRAETRLIEGETLRKKLHNTILELKGNIRVICRVRPPMPDDIAGSDTMITYPTSTEALGRSIELVEGGATKSLFTFDKVFPHDASQESVFVEVSELVQSALDGYKVCIFAYGQTGSGKTYTMMGKPDAPEHKGLIPRSIEQIFQTSKGLVGQGWKFKLQASMLEIYNDTIRDLLVPNKASGLEISGRDNGKQYTIKHDAKGNTYVKDLTIVDVCNIKEISLLFKQAAQSRSVGTTNMNEQSSRSHFVFTLRISGVNENTEQQVQGVLNLIDLAGSERLSKSCATGDRLKETQAINKSLSSLSSVILALANNESHVPFRDSKLTYLLQPYLGGDSKTLMFVNISSDRSSADESIRSLRFASSVNTISRPKTTVRKRRRSSIRRGGR